MGSGDYWLFGIWPYVAAVSVAIGPLARSVGAWRTRADLERDFAASCEWLCGDTLWRRGVASVLLGHLLILGFPVSVLAWNRNPFRLLALEGTLLVSTVLAVTGLAALLTHNVQRWRRRAAHGESAAMALATLAMISGLLLAIVERWASSWSAVTWPVYLTSIVGLHPDVTIVAEMPYLVRLHVASALALITVLPFTPAIALVIYPLIRLVRVGVRIGFSQ